MFGDVVDIKLSMGLGHVKNVYDFYQFGDVDNRNWCWILPYT